MAARSESESHPEKHPEYKAGWSRSLGYGVLRKIRGQVTWGVKRDLAVARAAELLKFYHAAAAAAAALRGYVGSI